MIDCEEALRWLRQAEYTLRSAEGDERLGFYAWACFKAHQAAEYALKALLRGAGIESFGHDLLSLWGKARSLCTELVELEECITLLNKMYIPTRYPDAWAAPSAPYENYTRSDARAAIECASRVYRVAWRCIRGACEDTGEEDTGMA